jgi:hypothetical protein
MQSVLVNLPIGLASLLKPTCLLIGKDSKGKDQNTQTLVDFY